MEEKYWKQFENSGRIEDYLAFVSNFRKEEDTMEAGESAETGYLLEAKGAAEAGL